jgi:hypothetical protein
MQGPDVPLKCKSVPPRRTQLLLAREDFVRIDLVLVLLQYVLDNRSTVVQFQVEAQEINISSEQRLGVVLVLDPVLADLVDFAEVSFRRFSVVVLVCVGHAEPP